MSRTIKVIDKALSIVEMLSRDPSKEFRLTEIADSLGIDRGTCSLIIKTLLQRGYIQHSAPRSGYKFGYMFYKLTDNSVKNEELTLAAQDKIMELGKKLNELIVLSVIKNDKRVFLMTTTPSRDKVIKTNIDKSVYASSAGRVIVAHYSPEHIERFISRVGLPTEQEWPEASGSEADLIGCLVKIRRAGYAVLYGQDSLVGIAAPVFIGGHVAGSIAVFVPKERMNDEILPSLLMTARSVEL